MTRSEIEAAKEADLWADIPDFPREDWRDEAREGDTQLGYWDWVEFRLSQREDEDDTPNEIDILLEACRGLVTQLTAMDNRQHVGLRIPKKDWWSIHTTLAQVKGLFEAWDNETGKDS